MSDEPKRRRTRVRSENRGGRDERGREETSAPVVEARRRGGARATRARVRATRAKGLHATSGRDPGARASSRRRRACVSRDRDPSLTHLDDERGARGGGLAGGDARHGGDDAKGGNGGGHRCLVCVRRERAVRSAGGRRALAEPEKATRKPVRAVTRCGKWITADDSADDKNIKTEYPYEKTYFNHPTRDMPTVTISVRSVDDETRGETGCSRRRFLLGRERRKAY